MVNHNPIFRNPFCVHRIKIEVVDKKTQKIMAYSGNNFFGGTEIVELEKPLGKVIKNGKFSFTNKSEESILKKACFKSIENQITQKLTKLGFIDKK